MGVKLARVSAKASTPRLRIKPAAPSRAWLLDKHDCAYTGGINTQSAVACYILPDVIKPTKNNVNDDAGNANNI